MILNPQLITRFGRTNESWREIACRVSGVSIGDLDSVREHLSAGALIPAGQILRGAGDRRAVLYNSYVIAAEPSEDLRSLATRLTEWTALGAGLGVNVSSMVNLRAGRRLLDVVRALGRSQQCLWETGARRTATMIVADLGIEGIAEAALEIARDSTLRHLNLAVNIEDAFMTSVSTACAAPNVATLRALISSALKCGNPGFVFIDRVNHEPLFDERLIACNACAEHYLRPDEGVPLASVNLAFFATKSFNFSGIEEAVRIGVRLLDDVVDATAFPSSAAADLSQRWRRVGVGVMGLDTAFRHLGIRYDSEDAVALSQELAARISAAAATESANLAKTRGAFAAFASSRIQEKRRNVGLLSIAPTGGISSLWGVSSGIEPLFGATLAKEEIEIQVDTGSRAMELPAPDEIHWSWHVRHLAAWQNYIDGGISKTVSIPRVTDCDEVLNMLIDSWKRGAKSLSVFRSGSREAGLRAI